MQDEGAQAALASKLQSAGGPVLVVVDNAEDVLQGSEAGSLPELVAQVCTL